MRVAVLFYGRAAMAPRTHENIKAVFSGYSVDYYLSTSPDLNEDLTPFKALFNPISVNNDQIPIDEFVEAIPNEFPFRPTRWIQSHFYNKQRVFADMMKSGKHYDIVIMYRVDLHASNRIDFGQFISMLSDRTVFIPSGNDWHGTCDQIAFGSVQAMSVYSSIYPNMIKYYLQTSQYLGEVMVKRHMEENNMNVVRFPFSYGIVR
jgi:hypothetical protein